MTETENRPFTFSPHDEEDDLPELPFIFKPDEGIDEAERQSWQMEGEAYEKLLDRLLDEN
jgi:hypothetical protein